VRRLLIAALIVICSVVGIVAHDSIGQTLQSRAPSGLGAPGVKSFVRVESSLPVFDVLYRYGHNDPAPNGAYGPNVTAPRSAWFLEYQRAGGYDVIAGALRNQPALISEGLRMLRFGLAREASDGSFPGSAWPFHGTALFLSETAPALIFLEATGFKSQFSSELRWQTGRMRRAVYHMIRAVGGPGKIDDSTKTHRFYEVAVAIGAVGVLSGDEQLLGWSKQYAWRGIGMERADGVMPEDGGHDSGYQALGMVSATRYLALLGTGKLGHALHGALQRGEAWERSRIGSDGSVNQSGDTRTFGCRERDPSGRCKTVFYAPIFSSLAHWATVSGDQRYAHLARLVWTRSGYGGH
jgi:hypothetical protein